jgi:excisionase family DNA binding protein
MYELDEVLTVGEVAVLLKIHPKTVYRFLKANELRGHRFGRIWRFKKSDIMKLLEKSNASQEKASATE